ncbi:MAG: lysylphosphatidylglycerol synthase transmembrane domain-containing protein [Geminicoccaceae bacterium]
MSNVLVQRLTSTILAMIVSALVLWWLLADGAGQTMLDALQTARFWPLMLGGLIAIAIQMIRAWRFALLRDGNLDLPSWTMVGIATKLVLFNFLLPFKLGEISFPLMMKRAYGTPFGQGVGILVLCRLLDLGTVVAIILLTAAWLLDPATNGWSPVLATMSGLMALVGPFLITDRLPRLRRLTTNLPRIDQLAGQMSHGSMMMQPLRQRLLVAVLTLSIWIAHAVIAWLVAHAVGAGLGLLPMAMASASSNLAFALPISGVAGLGPPQAAWASMLHWAGHDWAPAIATALLCHGVLLITLTAFGAAFWIGQSFRAKGTAHVCIVADGLDDDAELGEERSASSVGNAKPLK